MLCLLYWLTFIMLVLDKWHPFPSFFIFHQRQTLQCLRRSEFYCSKQFDDAHALVAPNGCFVPVLKDI